jgi:hypothetical protein
MNHPSKTALKDTFSADEIRKSNLILEGRMLEMHQQWDEAAQKFAQAAEQEERLGNQCRTSGFHDRAALHFYSAASCWGRAGNLYCAIALCDDLLRRTDLPDALRLQIENYLHVLRGRRAQWATESPGIAAPV